ncbi:MAG: hypothetical protein ABSH20_23125, partial [Tepidisphaeraceae bacterium]
MMALEFFIWGAWWPLIYKIMILGFGALTANSFCPYLIKRLFRREGLGVPKFPGRSSWPQTVILSVLAKDLAMRSKARCFASTLSMTTVAVQTVY